MSDYQPIACGVHSQYEHYAMHRSPLRVSWQNEQGVACVTDGLAKDILTRNKAEYMLLASESGDVEIRLDRIVEVLTL